MYIYIYIYMSEQISSEEHVNKLWYFFLIITSYGITLTLPASLIASTSLS